VTIFVPFSQFKNHDEYFKGFYCHQVKKFKWEFWPYNQGFVLFCGEFSPPGDKKNKGSWRIQQRNFLRDFFLKFAIFRGKKKLEVARFRQCVPLGRQN
jgi:hypothetical protein